MKSYRKKLRNAIMYLLSSAMLLTAIPEAPTLAAGISETGEIVDAAETLETAAKQESGKTVKQDDAELTPEELYEIDGGDAEYWKYYDAEGNRIESEGVKTYSSDASAASESDLTLESPYTGKVYTVLDGYEIIHAIDVSKYNNPKYQDSNSTNTINWDKVKADGVEAVIIRCGNRGYGTSGTMMTDPYFDEHMQGALAAGLKVGIYIYSQAITTEEAVEEANHCLTLCKDYLTQLDLPIVMDVEYANPGGEDLGGRLYDAGLTKAQQTGICQAFCQTIENAGYQPMIYANKSMLSSDMNPTELTDAGCHIWLARYNTSAGYTDSPYIMWQYASNGNVAGISGNVDVNFLYSSAESEEAPELKSLSSQNDGSVKLTWSTVPGAEGYEIQRSVDKTEWNDVASVKAAAAISFSDTTAVQTTTNYYRIRTYYTKGGQKKYGCWSAVGSVFAGLPTPVLKSASPVDYSSIKISWGAVTGADGYRVYRRVSGEGWSRIKDNQTGTSYTDTTVDTGTTYIYTVRAYRLIDGEKVFSDYIKAGVSATAMLDTPELKSAVSTAYNSIKVTWGAVNGADGYRVYRRVSGGGWSRIKDNQTGTSCTDTTAVTGTTYIYTVRAYRLIDGKKVLSDYIKAGVSAKAVTAAPQLGKVTSVNYKSLKITWSGVSGASGYRIYRKVSGESWKYLEDVASDVKSYTDQYQITCGKQYIYTVRAYRTVSGSRVYGKYDTAGISGKAIPSTPSVTLTSPEKGKVKISWNKISGATGYIVYRKGTAADAKWSRIKEITSASTVSYTVSATSGNTYYYTVRAYRTVGSSNIYSNYKSEIKITVK